MAFSLQAGSSLACCDNAHRGRADVLCQQHICIRPQSPPLHWPDNGAALLLPLHLNQKNRRGRGGGRKESYFLKTSAHSIKNCEMEGLNFFLRVQRLIWMSLISHSLTNSLQMTREVGPDYSLSKRCLNSVKKRKLPPNFLSNSL